MIDAHPALLAVSPQAPVTDYYLGDDVYHNGAFMLAANFGFYMNFRPRAGEPAPPQPALRFDYGTPDGYEFFLNMGRSANSEEKYFKRSNPFWTEIIDNTRLRRLLAGALDLEAPEEHQALGDDGGRLVRCRRSAGSAAHASISSRRTTPPATNMLVMGPWTHGGFRARRWRSRGQHQLRLEDAVYSSASRSNFPSSSTS